MDTEKKPFTSNQAIVSLVTICIVLLSGLIFQVTKNTNLEDRIAAQETIQKETKGEIMGWFQEIKNDIKDMKSDIEGLVIASDVENAKNRLTKDLPTPK
jgi:hypothetical protein